MTLRPEIWDTALNLLNEHGEFSIEQLEAEFGLEDSELENTRETLRDLEDLGWIEQTDESTWTFGWKGRAFSVSDASSTIST